MGIQFDIMSGDQKTPPDSVPVASAVSIGIKADGFPPRFDQNDPHRELMPIVVSTSSDEVARIKIVVDALSVYDMLQICQTIRVQRANLPGIRTKQYTKIGAAIVCAISDRMKYMPPEQSFESSFEGKINMRNCLHAWYFNNNHQAYYPLVTRRELERDITAELLNEGSFWAGNYDEFIDFADPSGDCLLRLNCAIKELSTLEQRGRALAVMEDIINMRMKENLAAYSLANGKHCFVFDRLVSEANKRQMKLIVVLAIAIISAPCAFLTYGGTSSYTVSAIVFAGILVTLVFCSAGIDYYMEARSDGFSDNSRCRPYAVCCGYIPSRVYASTADMGIPSDEPYIIDTDRNGRYDAKLRCAINAAEFYNNAIQKACCYCCKHEASLDENAVEAKIQAAIASLR